MPEPSGKADATAGGAGRNDAVRRGDAIPEMVDKVLKDTAKLSKPAAEDGGTETKLRARQEGEAPNAKKRMWEVSWGLIQQAALRKQYMFQTRPGRVLANLRTIRRSQLKM